jgi:membrane-bound lytic murein transglycosylase D
MFDGDWHLALASYNGGPGRVQRAMKRTRLADFWKLSARRGALPRETRDYVPMILAAIVIARNPAQYGFEVEPMPAPRFDTITLPKPVDLRRIAEWADTTIDEIQALNPELRRWTTPVRDSAYTLKVPPGTADIVMANLEEAVDAELASLNWHVVKRGETLSTIARKLRVGRTDLAEANYMRTSTRLTVGQKLIVPREATVLMAARADRPIPVTDARALAADSVVPAMASSESGRVRTTYRVKRGDTLSSIARLFETTVASLKSWNQMTGTRIQIGQRLTVYMPAN